MKLLSEFNTTSKELTGGVTGSARMKGIDGKYYQVKPSILDNSQIRRLKAGGTDRENFGECIASFAGRALLGPGNIPDVSLVYDPDRKKVGVASKYLEGDANGVRTLDEYALQNGVKFAKGSRHVVCVSGVEANHEQNQMSLDHDLIAIKQNLANAIVTSAIVGDHDVNPGNMLVITRNGHLSAVRIDLGHAFNDLLNASRINGGQLEDKENPILDYLNRKQVAGLGGDPSKLWRDYPGMVPSQEMVNALLEISSEYTSKIEFGILQARIEFSDLIHEMQNNRDQRGIKHVSNSLAAIYENITGEKLQTADLSIDQILDKTFTQFETFMKNNAKNTLPVANIMQLQLDIEKSLKTGKALPFRAYDLLKNNVFPMKNGQIQWIRMDNSPPFSGDFQHYLFKRAIELANQPGVDRESIISNYRLIRSAPPQIRASQIFTESLQITSTTDVKKISLEINEDNSFQGLDTKGLVDEIQSYIDKRMSRGEKKNWWGRYSIDDKVPAAAAFIDALHGLPVEGLIAKHGAVLEDGELGITIRGFLKRAGLADNVRNLLQAVESNSIKFEISDDKEGQAI